MKIAGIDYGSKMAGTTAIAYVDNGQACLLQSARRKDADRFILDWAASWEPTHIFLDAPLSLPGVYRKPATHDDYFYRLADRQLKAMSPMFLGGLTARAMQLKARLRALGTEVLEVYPGHLAKVLELSREKYKKEKEHLTTLSGQIALHLPCPLRDGPPESWHQFDALLALASGYRYQRGEHLSFGDEAEGLIVV